MVGLCINYEIGLDQI